MTTLEMGLTIAVALLYTLGVNQALTIKEEVNRFIETKYGEGYELSKMHGHFLVWLWPVATINVMFQKDEEEVE